MPPRSPTHYEVLGLPPGCSSTDVKRAYKQKALAHHPDKNPDGEDMFKRVVAAAEELGDPRRRRDYDAQLGRRPHRAAPGWATRADQFRAKANPTPADEEQERRRKEKEAEQRKQEREFASAGVNFADWYRSKMEAQEDAQAAAKERIAEAERERQREEAIAAEERAAAKRRQEEEDRRLEAARDEAARRQEEAAEAAERLERERREAQFRDREMAWVAQKDEHARVAEQAAADLKDQRQQLKEEQRRLAVEKERIREMETDLEGTRTMRMNAERERRQLLEEEAARVAAAKRDANLHEERLRAERQRMRDAAERERAESAVRMRELRETEQRWREEERRVRLEQKERARQTAAESRMFLRDVQSARTQHERELAEMRRETERMEQEMLAKLEMVRKAKREGRALDLSTMTLDIETIDGWVGGDPKRLRRRGSDASCVTQAPPSPPPSRPPGTANSNGSLFCSSLGMPMRSPTHCSSIRPECSLPRPDSGGFREKSPTTSAEVAVRARAQQQRQRMSATARSEAEDVPCPPRPDSAPARSMAGTPHRAPPPEAVDEEDSSDDSGSEEDMGEVARCARELLTESRLSSIHPAGAAEHVSRGRPCGSPAAGSHTARATQREARADSDGGLTAESLARAAFYIGSDASSPDQRAGPNSLAEESGEAERPLAKHGRRSPHKSDETVSPSEGSAGGRQPPAAAAPAADATDPGGIVHLRRRLGTDLQQQQQQQRCRVDGAAASHCQNSTSPQAPAGGAVR